MKVLKNNNYITMECPFCRSSLGIHQYDIRDSEMSFEVTCGACEKFIPVPLVSIPKAWIVKIIPDEF